MSYKMIACDLDETLLSADRTVCKRNRKAIAKAEQFYFTQTILKIAL